MKFRTALSMTIMVLLFSIMSAVFMAPAEALDPKVYKIDDDYHTTIPGGKTVEYNWLLTNPNDDVNYSVSISIEGSEGWNLELSDNDFVLKGEEHGSNETVITLAVDTSDKSHGDKGEFTLVFTLVSRDDDENKYIPERACSVTVESAITPTGIDVFGFHFDLSGKMDRPLVRFGISVAIYIVLGILLYFILIPTIRRCTKRTKTSIDDDIIEIIRRPFLVIIFSYAVMSSLSHLELPDRFIYCIMMAYQIVLIFMIAWTISRVIKVLLGVFGGLYAKRKKKEELHRTITPVFQKTLSFIVYFIAFMVAFDHLGIYITPFLASVGVIGLVIAFAAQETLSNLFSGIMILADRPYKVGDILQFDEGYYEVQRIGFRSTTLRNIFRNYVVNYPNRVIEKNKIINEFEPDRRYFLFRFMTLHFDTDIFKALDIIRLAAYDHPSVIKNDKRHSDPSARIKEFTDLGVRVYLWCYIYDWWDQWLANDEILQEILRRFKKEGIKLAYPSRILQFDPKAPLCTSEDGSVGATGMTFEGIQMPEPGGKSAAQGKWEIQKTSGKKEGMAGMKKAVEKHQAELRGKQ